MNTFNSNLLENQQELNSINVNGRIVTLIVGCNKQQDDSDVLQCRHKVKSQCIVTKLKRNSNSNMPINGVDETIFTCGFKDCGKRSHLVCFAEMIKKTNTAVGYDTVIFACGLRCYKQALKQYKEGEKQTNHSVSKFWDNDGVENGPSSMDILLEWITDSVNAEKYFGAKDTSEGAGFNAEDGVTKSAMCSKISDLIAARNGKYTFILV